MSAGGENTFHTTKEDIRKPESQDSKAHGGNVPAGSDTAAMQVGIHHLMVQSQSLTAVSSL